MFRIVKDVIFETGKAFNLVQMLDFIVNHLELYFERRLLNIAQSRFEKVVQSRFIHRKADGVNLDKIVHLDGPKGKTFKVHSSSSSEMYTVDMNLGICSCPVGKTSAPCKHQAAVLKVFRSINSINYIPLTSREGRRLFSMVSLGKDKCCEKSWYEGLHDSRLHEKPQDQVAADLSMTLETALTEDDYRNSPDNITAIVQKEEIVQPEKHVEVKGKLQTVFQNLTNKLEQDFGYFGQAIGKFVETFNKLDNYSCLVSALHCFGKENKLITSKCTKSAVRHGKMISVQPTSTARRKNTLSRGRRIAHSGRPLKRKVTSDPNMMPAKKVAKSQGHNFSPCVKNNCSNGKNHQKK